MTGKIGMPFILIAINFNEILIVDSKEILGDILK